MNKNPPTNKQILCLSRSYLSGLLPTLAQRHVGADYYHIVQTNKEARLVESLGGVVVLNMQTLVRRALKGPNAAQWQEPADLREITGFLWSPTQSDRYLSHFTERTRRRIAGALQDAIAELFEQRHYDGFLGEPVALFVTHLVFYHCRLTGTRPLLWCNTYFPGYFYFAERVEISQPVRRQPLSIAQSRVLQEVVRCYTRGVVDDKAGPVYHHAFSGTRPSRFGYFKQRRGESPLVLRPGMTSRLVQVGRLARALLGRLVFPWYSDFMTAGAVGEHSFYLRCLFAPTSIYDEFPKTHSKNNVVYPLQYEPEASLLYFAPHIISQISFVETILRALPAGRLLWVKEHPNQFGALGEKDWRSLKRRYGNLRFVHGRQSGRELVKMSALVVTITSTMGLDGLLLGRKVLVAGQVFYSGYTGAVRIKSYEHLARELNCTANYESSDNLDANVCELVEFGRQAYLGDPQPSTYLFSSQNLDSLVVAISEQLEGASPVDNVCV